MAIQRTTWASFDPWRSYTRRYNDVFYADAAIHLSGTVLDIGASQSNEKKYREIAEFDGYISLDLSSSSSLTIVGDGRQLPIKSDSVNTVVLSAVLEHVPLHDVAALISEVKRVLVDGGAVIAYVPFIYPIHLAPHDHYRPTYYGLQSLFAAHGFETEVYVGGCLSEVVLHTLFLRYSTLVDSLNLTQGRWVFIIPHLMIKYLSLLLQTVIQGTAIESIFSEWYLGQLVVGITES